MPELLSILQNDKRPAIRSTTELGIRGEDLAAHHLIANGYRLVLANFKVPVGRNSKGVSVTGEIDIIAIDGETLCFIEVKTRRSADFVPVIAAVDLQKQRQITRTAKVYRRIFAIRDTKWRYDVVTVLIPKDAGTRIELTKGFWADSKFRKKTWNDQALHEFP